MFECYCSCSTALLAVFEGGEAEGDEEGFRTRRAVEGCGSVGGAGIGVAEVALSVAELTGVDLR